MARASVALKMPRLKAKGMGEAIQSWNSDHSSATTNRAFATAPTGRRDPNSTCSTSASADFREVLWLMRSLNTETGGWYRPL